MQLGECRVENFGSYRELSFKFQGLGLALIYGTTGSGKSTVASIPPWILYGDTFNSGAADDVRSWYSTEPTKGELNVTCTDGTEIRVFRSRGSKPSLSDLFWIEQGREGDPIRGKDLKDTQKLLEARLGVSADVFYAGSILTEFSETGTFFTSNARARREVLEGIADLRLPSLVAERCSEQRKICASRLLERQSEFQKTTGRIEQANKGISEATRRSESFLISQRKLIKSLEEKAKNFEKEKEVKNQEIDELKTQRDRIVWVDDKDYADTIEYLKSLERCEECGGLKPDIEAAIDSNTESRQHNSALIHKKDSINGIIRLRESLIKEYGRNFYSDQLELEKKKMNPFLEQQLALERALIALENEQASLEGRIEELNKEVASLTQLQDLSYVLRGQLLQNTITQVEQDTNKLLEKYFDAEIRVTFSLEEDELQIAICNNGYQAKYKQLSRGQRSLLRLCFSVSMMEAAQNNAGIRLNNLFFDEVLDGLHGELKAKAFRLFEDLAARYPSVVLIDHAQEFQSLFSNKYLVTLESDGSCVTEDL